MTRWGIVATIKAPLPAILDFAAWHLDQGAHRLYLYLDEDPHGAEESLRAHPRIRVRVTDDAYWSKRGRRPDKHQARQAMNARHAANRRAECDWLAHIDVDEFLLPARPLSDQLAALPDDCLCARVRPVEALAPGPDTPPEETVFKAFHLDQADRQAAAEACFGAWARHLSGGFLSHVAGKLFFRTGLKGLQIKIHNVTLEGVQNPGERPLSDTELGHFHAADWDHFLASFRFRLARGSYRAELNPQVRRDGALNLHDLFARIEADGGETALRAFYDAVCVASPELTRTLSRHGLLRRQRMDLDEKRARHFPDLA